MRQKSRHLQTAKWLCAAAIGLWGLWAVQTIHAQDNSNKSESDATEIRGVEPGEAFRLQDVDIRVPDSPADIIGEPVAATRSPAQYYGLWTLLPPLVAIILAIFSRQVIPALVVAVLVGAYMMQFTPTAPLTVEFGDTNPVLRGTRLAVEHYLIGAIREPGQAQPGHISIILFTLIIGGMVGIIAASGGTRAMVQSVSQWASNRARGQILGWFAGLVVFFDDYANSMIVGPTMRPIYDKLRISREKLAYIVDSTAAPVASLALIGTWIGAEIGYIQVGMDDIGPNGPTFLSGITAYEVFLYSIPYRFYAIFALLMVLFIGWTARDFGPMRKAERRSALHSDSQAAGLEHAVPVAGKWWYAGGPIILLVILTLGILFYTGWTGRDAEAFAEMSFSEKAGGILKNANAYLSILYGAVAALLCAFVIGVGSSSLSVSKAVEAALDGMSRMFPAIVILILAWALSATMTDLELAQVAQIYLAEKLKLSANYLPLAIFVTSAIVSFATGTSWGTMGIICPVAVTVAARMVADLPEEQASGLFFASVGSVLAGAVFGDHCSPISDTTVLSALASSCSLEAHVWTQLPYALTAAVVAMGCGDVLCSRFHQPAWVGLGAGAVLTLLIVLVIGRKNPQIAEAETYQEFDS